MKRNTLACVILVVFGLACASTALADGFVVVRPAPELPDPTQLAVKYHNVDITIRDQVANVHIDQVFHNLNGRDVEGEYIFPIPDGAAVSDFVLYVDGKPVHAEAMSATEALNVYRELVRQSKDPALLEYAGREMFRAHIYPFPAHGDRRVLLDYDHLIERQSGLYRFIYPLSTEKFSSRPLESAVVTILLETDRPIRNAYCPSHAVDIEHLGSRRLRMTWEESGTKPDRDLVLYYSLAEGPMDIRLVPYRPDGKADGYFMLLASMGQDDEIAVAPKDVVFVIDQSGSMGGVKIEQARDALAYCLEHLNPRDRFNVVTFSSSVDAFSDGLQEATRRRVRDAATFVQSLEAGGSTNISGALDRALNARFSDERPAFVVFITDGLPTAGETDPKRILTAVGDRNGRDSSRHGRPGRGPHVRIFPFGVGYDVNAILLDQLAEENAGSPSYVRPTEDLQSRIEGFYDQVANPVMTDLEIDVSGVRFRNIQPAAIPDMFRGSQLVLFGRYRGNGKVKVTLTGVLEGRRRSFDVAVRLPKKEGKSAFVGRLWATRKVGSLLRQVRLHGEEPELVEEIKDLGLRFGIVTPYTSFLVDESKARDRETLVSAEESWNPGLPGYASGKSASSQDKRGGLGGFFRGLGLHKDASKKALSAVSPSPSSMMDAVTGRMAFEVSNEVEAMVSVESEHGSKEGMNVRVLAGRTYLMEGDVWKDTGCPEGVKVTKIDVGSDEYFELLLAHPELGPILALGDRVIFQTEGRWFETVPAV